MAGDPTMRALGAAETGFETNPCGLAEAPHGFPMRGFHPQNQETVSRSMASFTVSAPSDRRVLTSRPHPARRTVGSIRPPFQF